MAQLNSTTWVLESDVFPNGDCIADAAASAGHRVIAWDDDWWTSRSWPAIKGPCLFHGSLGNADRIRRELSWVPGAFCNTRSFFCSSWYEDAARFLLHPRWEILPASQLVDRAREIFDSVGDGDAIFVRPDSPLKPFSGRVVKRGQLSLASLDHGFYYDDANIPVVVAPVQEVVREWRFVVANQVVTTGCAYVASGRTATADASTGAPWAFASLVADEVTPPDPVYVLDVCETSRGLHLLELNPFSGADLYACSGNEVVKGVLSVLSQLSTD